MGKYLDSSGLGYFWNKVKSYFVKGNTGCFTGTCDTAAATAEKAVTCADFTSADLKAGAMISVYFSATNSAAVASLQLNVNGTGAKNIKYIYNGSYANIPSANYIKAGQIYNFTYDGTYWVVQMGYNTNTTPTYLAHYNTILAKTTITAESLIVGDSAGYSRVAAGITFDISYPILWCTAKVNANATNYANIFIDHYDRNIATGAKSGFTSAPNKMIYLVITVSGNTATVDSDIVTDALPASDDGKVYIALGRLGNNSAGADKFILHPVHPMFIYKDGAVRLFSGHAETVNGHTVLSDVPANAQFTDTTYESLPAASSASGTDLSIVTTGEKYTWNSKGDVTGVKGNAESSYRTGQVNLTPANIGAAASSHTHSSYVNQNAFSNVKVGSTTVAADSATDTLELVAGDNITLTPDATNDKVTIEAYLDITTPTITKKTVSGVSSSIVTVRQYGKVVSVDVELTMTAAVSSQTNLATGLPAPGWTVRTQEFIAGLSSFSRPLRFILDTSGNLDIRYGAAGTFYHHFTYLAA